MIRRFAQALIAISIAALAATVGVSAGPATAPPVRVEHLQADAAQCSSPAAVQLLGLINDYRAANGLQPLLMSASLAAAAQHHADSMASFDYFGDTLTPEGITFDQNIANYGYPSSYVGANIAAGPDSADPAVVLAQWQAVPSQLANLLNPRFLAVGLGSASNPSASYVNYWAAAFGDDSSDAVSCDQTDEPTAVATEAPTETPTSEPTETATPEPTETATALPTATQAAPTKVPVAPDVPTNTPEAIATATAEPTETATLAATETPSPEPTATIVPTDVPTMVPTEAASPSPSATEPPTEVATIAPTSEPASPVASPFASPGAASPVAAASPVPGTACTLNRTEARAGQDLEMTCTGFGPVETVNIYFNETREADMLGYFKTDDGGTGTFTFPAPETPAGSYPIIARGATSLISVDTRLVLTPGIVLTPKSGDPGDVINADLTGFQPNEAVTITWYDTANSVKLLRRVTVGEDGSLTTTFRCPGSAPGPHTIEAIGLNAASATASFEVKSS